MSLPVFEAICPALTIFSSMVEVKLNVVQCPLLVAKISLLRREQFVELLAWYSIIFSWSRNFVGISASKQISTVVHAHNGVIAPHSAQGPCFCLLFAVIWTWQTILTSSSPEILMTQRASCGRACNFSLHWRLRDGHLPAQKVQVSGVELNLEELNKHPYLGRKLAAVI